jgi:hypothetical protein
MILRTMQSAESVFRNARLKPRTAFGGQIRVALRRQLLTTLLAKAKGIVGEAPHACAPSGHAKRMPLSTLFREFEE